MGFPTIGRSRPSANFFERGGSDFFGRLFDLPTIKACLCGGKEPKAKIMGQSMNIGDAASASGVTAKMIRHYEKIGLIEPAERAASGYRLYGTNDVHTLRFIRRARNLGFSVTDIEQLLALWRNRQRASADVKVVANQHLQALQTKAFEIQGMIGALETLVSACSDDKRPECPILGDLADQEKAVRAETVGHRFGFDRLG